MSGPSRLLSRELKDYREKQLERQNFLCPLCGTVIAKDEAALDHCHKTGKVRNVLHKSCNSSEGRVLFWAKRNRAESPEVFLQNLLQYWKEDYGLNPLHPKHNANPKKKRRKQKLRALLKKN